MSALPPPAVTVTCLNANVAQLAEQLIRNQQVGSSNLPVGSNHFSKLPTTTLVIPRGTRAPHAHENEIRGLPNDSALPVFYGFLSRMRTGRRSPSGPLSLDVSRSESGTQRTTSRPSHSADVQIEIGLPLSTRYSIERESPQSLRRPERVACVTDREARKRSRTHRWAGKKGKASSPVQALHSESGKQVLINPHDLP